MNFVPGLFRHYKGGKYLALFLASHHETGEQFVVYIPYDHAESGIQMREYETPGKDSWTDMVQVKSAGFVATLRRFERIGDLEEKHPI